jgi:demethoxyubiquinone hydroxylase (CLK1/Coq7/Cat5 family)
MNISFEIPTDIEQQIRATGVDLNREAKEVYLMEQYRQAKITHRQLQEALGLSFHETEDLLKQRGIRQCHALALWALGGWSLGLFTALLGARAI